MQDSKCGVRDTISDMGHLRRAHSHKTRRFLEEGLFPPCPSSFHTHPGGCTLPSQEPSARRDEPLVWSTLSVAMVLNLPATKVHMYQFDNVSCSLDKNTNKPHGVKCYACKVNQCGKVTKLKTCCWLTIVWLKIRSRSVCGHKEHTYYLPSILQSFFGARVLVLLGRFTWAEVWQMGTVPTLK